MLPTFPPFPMPEPDPNEYARALEAICSFLVTHPQQELWTTEEKEEFDRLAQDASSSSDMYEEYRDWNKFEP